MSDEHDTHRAVLMQCELHYDKMDQRDFLGTIASDLCALAAAWSVMPVASGEGLKISTTTRVPEKLNLEIH